MSPCAVGHLPFRSPDGGCIPAYSRARIAVDNCRNLVGNPNQDAPHVSPRAEETAQDHTREAKQERTWERGGGEVSPG